MWLNQFKKALILEEVETLSSLLDKMPKFDTLEEMEAAAYLLEQCRTLMQNKKSETSKTILQLKNSLNFVESTPTQRIHSINLKL